MISRLSLTELVQDHGSLNDCTEEFFLPAVFLLSVFLAELSCLQNLALQNYNSGQRILRPDDGCCQSSMLCRMCIDLAARNRSFHRNGFRVLQKIYCLFLPEKLKNDLTKKLLTNECSGFGGCQHFTNYFC
jgi:hypothetical protein